MKHVHVRFNGYRFTKCASVMKRRRVHSYHDLALMCVMLNLLFPHVDPRRVVQTACAVDTTFRGDACAKFLKLYMSRTIPQFSLLSTSEAEAVLLYAILSNVSEVLS